MSDTDTLQTYYTLLGVEEEATAAEVRKAYLKRAAECHPDKHPEDDCATERFQALGEAYECLKDPVARKEYDAKLQHLRTAGPSSSSSGSPPRHQHHDYHPSQHDGFLHSFSQPPSHPLHPRRHTFFRASGFSPFPPFPRAFQQGGAMPPPLAMFAEFMANLTSPGGPRLGGGMFDMPFRHDHKRGPLPPGPFGPIPDPFDHPFLRHPFTSPGLAPPPPPMPGFRQRPHPHHQPRHHHPYPFPPGPAALLRSHPGPMMPHLGGPPPGLRGHGQPGGMPGRCHRATFEIKDPAGRTTGFVHQSTMSWSSFR